MSSVNTPVFSADDESTWKVSGQYPPREVDGMDWQRCALLHNKILRLGWTARYGEAIPLPAQSWWNRFITSPTLEQTWTTRLSASLVQFLKCAQVTPQENEHAFHYYFSGLAYPGGFYQSKQEGEFEILTLYPLNNLNLGGHLDGLSFNQENHLAILQTDIDDANATLNGRTDWDPLETVLSAWLDMIEVSKIVALPEGVEMPSSEGNRPKYNSWVLLPHSAAQLKSTLDGFAQLVVLIEILMEPNASADQALLQSELENRLAQSSSDVDIGLCSEQTLNEAGIPPGFLREFLLNARKPKFKYVAPGLTLPSPEILLSTPFKNMTVPFQFGDHMLPIPLFPSDIHRTTPANGPPFGFPFDKETDLPAGLWLSPCDRNGENPFEDSCRLVLPFAVGRNGWAVTSDGDALGSNPYSKTMEARDCVSELYQQGYNHFIPAHDVRLEDVLRNWTAMVGAGEWKVGADGVQSEIEIFRDADTEEGWFKYQIEANW